MEDIIKKIINGDGIEPHLATLEVFETYFPNAININWYKHNQGFEAIFYFNQMEHIALFDLHNVLLEYRRSIAKDFLPEPIRAAVESLGEIMNIVLINKGDGIQYELIYRDKDLKRYLTLYNDFGQQLSVKKL